MTAATAPQVAGFNCPSCGSSIALHAQGWAVTVVCGQCGAQLDATDPNLRILQYGEYMEMRPRIPLGTRGTWKGATWQIIGYQEVEISVEGTLYSWAEYVCFNPYRGFLYLSEYQGHWNVIEKQHRQPTAEHDGSIPTVEFGGITFKHFQTATAYSIKALGEFPWELRVGDRVTARDYVSPPYILSAEASDNEVTWSLGTYTPPAALEKAFGVTLPHSPQGVFANQPNPHAGVPGRVLRVFGLALAVLAIMFSLNVALSNDAQVYSREFVYERTNATLLAPNATISESGEPTGAPFVTEPFTLTGRSSGVAIELSAPLQNDWLFFSLALINEATGESREVTRQLSYYSGTDSDGNWSEGSRSESVRLAQVPAGRYFLRVQPEGGEVGRGAIDYRLTVRRDHPYYLLYGIALLLLFVPTVLAAIPSAGFESRRWAESDHAPASSGDSDDDDE